jgi:glycosyltransferase involved in cell wall biosynthesis
MMISTVRLFIFITVTLALNNMEQKFRILICAGIFPPESGGPATYSLGLARSFQARGFAVRVITYVDHPYKTDYSFPVVQISRSWLKPWHYYKYLRAVKRFGQDADVLYAQDTVSAGYPTCIAAKSLKKPFVVKVTGDYSWEQATRRGLTNVSDRDFQGLPTYPFLIGQIRNIQIRVCQSANLVIAPAEYLKNVALGWGVKEKQVKVIYNSVEPLRIFDKAQARQRLGLKGSVLISVGRLVPHKSFDKLIELARRLRDKIPDLYLVIVGEGQEEGRLKALIEKLGLQNHVRLTGRLSQTETAEYIAAADLFVLNSSWEGLSHVILESLAAGTPVLVSDVGGNREIVQAGLTGLLFPYNDLAVFEREILRFLHDEGLRKHIIRNGKTLVQEKFGFDRMVNDTIVSLGRLL